MIIELDGIPIEIIRKKIKNIHLRIYPPDGLVKMSVPLKCNEQFIRRSLEAKSAWIYNQRERIRSRSIAEESVLTTGSSISFQGQQYLLIVKEQHGPHQIKLNENLIYCYTSPNSSPMEKQAILDNWYKHQMQLLLPNLIKRWEAIIGVKVAEWGVKKMKTRWGSCNIQAARIWLNLNLIKKPPICLEYVLAHELVHLLEPSHNSRFYTLMSQFMPQWQVYDSLLKGVHYD